MAKKDATTFKAAIAAAEVQINLALADDTTAGEMALEFRNGFEQLRKLENLFVLNEADGQYAANDAYVDAVYAGKVVLSKKGRMKKLEPFTPQMNKFRISAEGFGVVTENSNPKTIVALLRIHPQLNTLINGTTEGKKGGKAKGSKAKK